jgi:predicted nucleic acid-binding protein
MLHDLCQPKAVEGRRSYIGAHAAIGRLALLTRDAARYRSYFPKVEILAPTMKT